MTPMLQLILQKLIYPVIISYIQPTSCGLVKPPSDHIARWASDNHLQLNRKKSYEVIVRKHRGGQGSTADPPPLPDIVRRDSINMLGVTFSHRLSVQEHVTLTIQSCARSLYTLRMLKAHGMPKESIYKVFHSTTLAKIFYALSSWRGYATSEDVSRIEAFRRRSIRLGYCRPSDQDFTAQSTLLDTRLFKTIKSNPDHILFKLLPPAKTHSHRLRPRVHNLTIPFNDTSFVKSNFITCMLLHKAY